MTHARLFPFRAAGRVAAVRAEEGTVRLTGPDTLRPLTESLNTAFLIDPERVLALLTAGRGQTFGDVLSYAYPGDDGTILHGCVRCDYYEQKLLIREADFAIAALWLVKAAAEGGVRPNTPFTGVVGYLRWQRWLRLPRSLAMPFEPHFAVDVTGGRDRTRIARILSNGDEGRIDLYDPASQQMLLDIFCAPARADDPALVPFHEATLTHLVQGGLHEYGLAGRIVQPGDP